jgi:phospholipid/cholesterol/gamma-HCH transport system substrate-binding protein
MEQRANFLIVGVFVAATLLAALKFIVFIAGPSWTSQISIYELVITGPATGLSPGSEVLFNGVKVGTVTRIFMSEDASDQVIALAAVEKATPIRTNTRGFVTQSGLMGSVLVSLEGASESALDITASIGHQYPRLSIKGVSPGDFVVSFEDFSGRLSRTVLKAMNVIDSVAAPINSMKWDLETASNAFKVAAPISSAPPQIKVSLPEMLSQFAAYLDRLNVKTASFNKSPAVDEIVSASTKLTKASAADLAQMDRLAAQLRKKVDAFDNSIRDLDLTLSTPRLGNQGSTIRK